MNKKNKLNTFFSLIICFSCFMLPMSLIEGILSIAGKEAVFLNDRAITGFLGFVVAMVIGVAITLILALIFFFITKISLFIHNFINKHVTKKNKMKSLFKALFISFIYFGLIMVSITTLLEVMKNWPVSLTKILLFIPIIIIIGFALGLMLTIQFYLVTIFSIWIDQYINRILIKNK